MLQDKVVGQKYGLDGVRLECLEKLARKSLFPELADYGNALGFGDGDCLLWSEILIFG